MGSPPHVPEFAIRRGRLERLLDEHADNHLILVRGPAGAGKSVLVAQWLRARGEPCIWLTVDHFHDDPAVQQAVDAATRHHGTRVNLVLDGVDGLHGPGARHALTRLVEEPPPALRLVLIARSKPHLGLERARLRGDMFEVGSSALRFQRMEVAALAATWDDLRVDTAALEQATLGWAAGLRLVHLQSAAGRPIPAALQEPDGPASEYVREELVDGTSSQLRSFLEVACWLPRLTWPLCVAVAAQLNGGRTLTLSEMDGLPLLPISSDPGAFRFPPILTRVLQQAQHRRDPASVTTAVGRAAEACRRAGELATAVELLLQAGRSDDAASACAELASRGEASLQLVDATLERHRGVTHASAAWLPWRVRAAVVAGRVEDARTLLRHVSDAPTDPPALLVARAAVAERLGDVDDLLSCADALLAATPPGDGATEVKARAWKVRALAWAGEGDGARQALQALETAAAAVDGATFDVALARAWVAWLDGDMAVAAAAIDVIIASDRHRAGQSPEPELLAGAVHREQNHLAEAALHLQQAGVLAGRQPHAVASALAASELARCQRVAGPSMEALELVISARSACPELPAAVDAHLRTTEARVRLDQGDVLGAHAVIREARPDVDARLLATRIALREAPDRAGQLLASLQAPTPRQEVEKLLLQAQLPEADPAQASAALMAAISHGERLGLLRTFLDEGDEVVRRLPELALASANRSLGRVAALACQELSQAPTTPSHRPIEQLTDRELAVLRLLPLRMSNREIAAQMYISINTLKTHVRAVYRKLEVQHRSAAVRRAKALQLV